MGALFAACVTTQIGNGEATKFWVDRWLHGKSIAELAPTLMAFVRKRGWRKRTVQEALQDNAWAEDIIGGLPVQAMWEVLQLLQVFNEVQLQPGEEDMHIWTRESSGTFTSRSAYEAFFMGGVEFEPYKLLWKAWAPMKVKLFLWLAIWKRCWTADRLARRGLQHPQRCVLCDQEEEDMHHLLIGCVFVRDIWFQILQGIQMARLAPIPRETSFIDWWRKAAKRAGKERRKGLNTLVQLVAWSVWKHRNRCIFDNQQPRRQTLMDDIREEASAWAMAGARSLRQLL